MTAKKVGHLFLAELGKKRLRPGGIETTGWLMEKGKFSSDTNVLELACNMGTTLTELVEKYHCKVTGIDLDKHALAKAEKAIKKAGYQDCVSLVQGNALQLPFPDETFDIVINEAMLTMLDGKAKETAVAEYFRVLKPQGCLLTHDISVIPQDQIQEELSQTIKVKVAPLSVEKWQELFRKTGFKDIEYQQGKMSLMNPVGMIRNEGIVNTLRILKNGLKKQNRQQFFNMFKHFKKNKNKLKYIAVCSKK